MPAWLAPALGALGNIGSGFLGFLGSRSANRASAKAAQAQMDFQERMSSTAYQRSMADMEKAGLNPILAYQKGGASTPGGAMPNITNQLEAAAASAKSFATDMYGASVARDNARVAKQEGDVAELANIPTRAALEVAKKADRIIRDKLDETKQTRKEEPSSAKHLRRTQEATGEALKDLKTAKTVGDVIESFTKAQENARTYDQERRAEKAAKEKLRELFKKRQYPGATRRVY